MRWPKSDKKETTTKITECSLIRIQLFSQPLSSQQGGLVRWLFFFTASSSPPPHLRLNCSPALSLSRTPRVAPYAPTRSIPLKSGTNLHPYARHHDERWAAHHNSTCYSCWAYANPRSSYIIDKWSIFFKTLIVMQILVCKLDATEKVYLRCEVVWTTVSSVYLRKSSLITIIRKQGWKCLCCDIL